MSALVPERVDIIDDLRSTTRAAVRRLQPGSGDAVGWRLLTEKIGIAGLLAPEAQGGLEFGAAETVAVASEIGASAINSPFLSHAIAATVLLRTGASDVTSKHPHEVVNDLLTAAATAERCIAVGWQATDGVVVSHDGGTQLNGTISQVVDAPGADVFLVEAVSEGETVICVADNTGSSELSVLDPSRSIGTVTFRDTPCQVLFADSTARHALAAARQWSLLALAADQLGIARRSLEITVEYVGIRSQFGAVIGSFQAVKHRCTDVLLEVELAAALIDQAAAAVDGGNDRLELVSTAFLQATTAALAATDALIHLHGGIGFTWEHVAHHYYRRARTNADLLGPIQNVRDSVAASAGL